MTERSDKSMADPATDPTVRPGDFPIGSRKSRAAMRARLQVRHKPVPPAWGTVRLDFLTVDRAREIYAKLCGIPGAHLLGTGWFPIRWPDGFDPNNNPG
jgi:hypothetical protein